MTVDANSALIVGDPQGILSWQLRPHNYFCYYDVNSLLNNILSNYIIKLSTFLTKGRKGSLI